MFPLVPLMFPLLRGTVYLCFYAKNAKNLVMFPLFPLNPEKRVYIVINRESMLCIIYVIRIHI